MTQTEWIISLDDDLKDYDELFVGNVRDGDRLTRCRDCKYFEYDHFDAVYFPTETGEAERVPLITAHEICTRWGDGCKTSENGYCFMAEREEE